MAAVTPIEYTGLIFCPTVSTGAFVARRNGKVFVTGNSGFPKSLDVGKAIDKAAGARGHDSKGFNAAGLGAGYVSNGGSKFRSDHPDYVKPKGVTEAACQWSGWGTALKPALEPITVARKPFPGTVAANVMEHGTGAINVDGCRVHADDVAGERTRHGGGIVGAGTSYEMPDSKNTQPAGRWPANLILTYPEDEYMLRDDVTPDQLHKLAEWMNENAKH